MRRTTAAVALATGLAAWPGALQASAQLDAPEVRTYRGTTSAGDAIHLFSKLRDGVPRFLAVGLEGTARCEDGSTLPFVHGLDFSPRGLPMPGNRVEVGQVNFSQALFLDGTLGTRAGSGTITHLFAALDADEEPILCSTGEVAWSVERVPAAVDPAPPARTLVVEPTGGAIETSRLGPSGGETRLTTGRFRLRNYQGRTSARYPLFFATAKQGGTVALFELGIAWDLACDDGSGIGLGIFVLFAGEPLEPARVDYDVSAPELALHVNGRLGVHSGRGTTASVMPALTADLEAQACRSGELTWRAWRTDPGATPA